MRARDGKWQMLCESSGLDQFPLEENKLNEKKRKADDDDINGSSSTKKQRTAFESMGNKSQLGTTSLLTDFSSLASVHLSQNEDFMALAASSSINDTSPVNESEFYQLLKTTETNSDSTNDNKIGNNCEGQEQLRQTELSTIVEESEQSTLIGRKLPMKKKGIDEPIRRSSRVRSKMAISISGNTNDSLQSEIPSLMLSKNNDFADLADISKISLVRKNRSTTDSTLIDIDESSETSIITITNESSIQTDIPSIKLSQNEDFMDLANKSSIQVVKRSRRFKKNESSLRWNNETIEEESSRQTEIPSIRLSQNSDFNDLANASNVKVSRLTRSKAASIMKMNSGNATFTNEEESSRQTEIPSVRLSQNQDFNELAATPVVKTRSYQWSGRKYDTINATNASEIDEGSIKKSRKNISENTSSTIIRGALIPKRNFDNDSLRSKTSSKKRNAERSVTDTSQESGCFVKVIKPKRNLDYSDASSKKDRLEAFKADQRKRKTTLFVNKFSDNEISDEEDRELIKPKKNTRSESLLSSQSVMSSQEDNNHPVLRRSTRKMVNVNDSVFQTATPAVVKPQRKTKKQIDKNNITSRSCSPESVMSEGYSEFPILVDESVANKYGTPQVGKRKHAIIKGNKEKEQKILVVKRPKIIKPDEDQHQFLNLRRSKRNRIPPVDGTLLQKPLYERDQNGDLTLVGVSDVEVSDPLFTKFGTTDFTEISRKKKLAANQKKQSKAAKERNLLYYGLRSNTNK
uniref:Fanconi anemia group M protein n=1 Tax=Parastrongyloides trichosuri TaxID=131310 RepID=A0A0N4ZSV2_PARTI